MIRRSLPLVVSAGVFAVCGYALNVFLARHLGPTDYGDVGLTLSVMSLATVILTSGVPIVVSRQVAASPGPGSLSLAAGMRAQAVVGAVLVAVLLAAAPLVTALYRGTGNWWLVAIAAATLPGYGLMTVLVGYWNGLHRFWRQSSLVSAYSVAKVALIVPFALCHGPLGALVGYMLAPLVGIAVGRIGAAAPRPPQVAVRPMVGASVSLSLLALTTLATYSVDLYLVAGLSNDTTATSFYVVAQSIALIPLTAFSAVGQVSTPTIARLVAAGDVSGAGEAVRSTMRNQVLLLVPVVLTLNLSATWVVRLLYGSDFVGAAPTVKLLVPAYAMLSVLIFLTGCLTGAGASARAARCAAIGLVITIAAGAMLTPALGAPGAALGLGIGATAATLFAFRAVSTVVLMRHSV